MELKEILEKIALPARSKKTGFYETEKLEAIKTLLEEEGSPFHLIFQNEHTWIFGKKEPEQKKFSILVSSHADIVNGITKPFSEFDEEKKYFKGTYDNMGTNGACVALMLNEDVPDNVYFAFNDEEETGRCLGAGEALKYVGLTSQRKPFCIALDVTDEGYDNDRLFTLEGMNSTSAAIRERVLKLMLAADGEKQSFEVVKMKKDDNVSYLPKSYVSDELTVFDESVFYAEQNCNSFSFDLPTEGSMHSDSGLYVKEAVFKGYVKSLLQTIYVLDAVYPDRQEAIKKEKDELIQEAIDTPFRKTSYSYSEGSYGSSYGSYYSSMGYSDYGYGGYSRYSKGNPYSYLHDYDEDDDPDYTGWEGDPSVEGDVINKYLINIAYNMGEDQYEEFAEKAGEALYGYYDDETADKILHHAFEYCHPGVFGGEYCKAEEMDEDEVAEMEAELFGELSVFAESYTYDDWDQFFADAIETYGETIEKIYPDENEQFDFLSEVFEETHQELSEIEDWNMSFNVSSQKEKKEKKKDKKDKYPKKDKNHKAKSLSDRQKELEDEKENSYYAESIKYSDDNYENNYGMGKNESDDYDDHGL